MIKKFIFSVIVICVILNTRLLSINNAYIARPLTDSTVFSSFMHIMRTNILSGKYPFSYTNIMQYPRGFNFECGCDGIFPVTVGALSGIFLAPPLAYNVSILITLFLNIFLSAVFFGKIRKLIVSDSEEHPIIFLSALIFGASPYVLSRMVEHLSLFFIGGFPVFLYGICLFLFSKTDRVKELFFIFSGLLLLPLGSLQYLIWVLMSLPFISLTFLFKFDSKKIIFNKEAFIHIASRLHVLKDPRYQRYLLLCFFCFTSVFLFIYMGYFVCFYNNIYLARSWFNTASLFDLFIPNPIIGPAFMHLPWQRADIEYVVTMGVIPSTVFLFFLRSAPNNLKSGILFNFILLVLFSVFGLSFPMVPEGSRYIVVFTLLACLVMLVSKINLNPYIWVFVIFIVIAEKLLYTIPTAVVDDALAISDLRFSQGSAVLEVPLDVWAYSAYYSNIHLDYHNKKTVGGLIHPSNLRFSLISEPLARFSCAPYILDYYKSAGYKLNSSTSIFLTDEFLSKNQINHIIVNKKMQEVSYCTDSFSWLQLYLNGSSRGYKVIYDSSTTQILVSTSN